MQKNFIEIIDLKTGKTKVIPMHSFTCQFLACLHEHFGFEHVFRARCIDNSQYYGALLKNAYGGNNDLLLGLAVGSGSTPGNTSDYCLETPLTMYRESTAFTNPNDITGFDFITIERYFENVTESPVNVREIGILAYGSNDNLPILISRDVLAQNEVFAAADRKLIKLHIGFPDHFTINWLHFLLYRLSGSNGDVKNTLGDWEDTNGSTFKLNAPLNNKSYGILIGTGTTQPTVDDYVMESLESTNWTYSAVSLDHLEKALDGSETELQLKRDFTNQTGETKTIREIGIVSAFDGQNSYEKCLIAHYVIDPVQVANGQTLTIKWNFATPIATFVPE